MFSGYHYPINETIKLLKLLEKQTEKRKVKLPQNITIEDGLKMAKWYKTTPFCEDMDIGDIIEELIGMYLTDNYERNVESFEWNTRNNDIEVTNIIWEK